MDETTGPGTKAREASAAPGAGDEILRDTTRFTRLLAALNEPAPTEAYLDRILSTISELFFVDIAVLLDPDGTGNFKPVASIGLPDDFDARLFDDFRATRFISDQRATATLSAPERHPDPRMGAGLRALGIESGAWIPVSGSREPRGALMLARCKPVPFSREETELLSTMAYRIGLALEQITQKEQLEALARGVREIVRHPDEAHIAEQAVGLFAAMVKADAAVLVAPGPEGDLACEGSTEGSLRIRTPLPAGAARLLAGADEAGTGEVVHATESEETRAVAEALGYPCESLLAAAVPIAGRRAKWLLALRRKPIAFGEGSRQIASLYSSQIGSFLENAALYGDLRRELGERARAEAALRENEKALRARQDELYRMVETRDRLFSIIGHDLRGPVGSMCDLLHLVLERSSGSSTREQSYILSEILQAGDNINQLLLNLMEWGKAQQADVEIRPRPVALRLCVEDVFAILGAQAKAKGVQLVDEVESPTCLVADEGSLQTILRNLVSNAVKFTEPGGRVVVSAGIDAGHVRVRVSDTGVGMDEAALRAVLDFSSRRSTRGTGGEKGTGLGLILCKDLAEMNAGTMSIESEPGAGTAVALEFQDCARP